MILRKMRGEKGLPARASGWVPLILLLLFAACSKEVADTSGVDREARLKIVHASVNAGAMDAYYNGVKRSDAAMNYTDTLGYFPAGRGTDLSVDFRVTGTVNAVASQLISLRSLRSYTVYLTGARSGEGYSGLRTILSSDTLTAPADGAAKIRIVHASPNAGRLDFYVGADTVRRNVFYGQVTYMRTTPAREYTFSLTEPGTKTEVLSAKTTLESGGIYTFLLRGLRNNATTPLTLQVLKNN
ncbi:MAG: DUF4397 domain-containing protein [Mucilaginibacter polytrichastri]|nr:DUF4397 domain-containing protein [Mucilaginibacter polytrichastri]